MTDLENVSDLRHLHKAFKRVRRGKSNRVPAIRFSLNPLEGLCLLKWSLEDQSFVMGKYTEFEVRRPAVRQVKTCAFQDKIVLGSLCKNCLWEKIEPHLIDDNYASRVNYGTHVAMDDLAENMHNFYLNHGKNGYFLRIDARKYFFNLSHDLIAQSLESYGFDSWTMWLVREILKSSYASVKHGYVTPGRIVFCDMDGMPELYIGSPIGNETSQAFAVDYANPIDHFIKDQKGCKYYGRYMDDSYVIHDSREYLENLLTELREKYYEIGLELNHKTQIQPLKNGIKFLGMHYYLTDTGKVIKNLKPENIKYQRVHLREHAAWVASGKITEKNYWERFNAWDNHASYANTGKLRKQMRKYAKEVLENAYRKKRELGEVRANVSDTAFSDD